MKISFAVAAAKSDFDRKENVRPCLQKHICMIIMAKGQIILFLSIASYYLLVYFSERVLQKDKKNMADAQMLSNRRKHPRIPINTTARIKVRGKDIYPLYCSDISMGGMRMRIEPHLGPIVQRSKGKLWLTQQYGGDNIEFEAQFKVLWVDSIPPGSNELCMGIEFIKMKRKHQDSLLRLLQVQGAINSDND